MAKTTCKLKDNALLFRKGQHYTNANITDDVALALLKQFPGLESQFVAFPDGYTPVSPDLRVNAIKKAVKKAGEDLQKANAKLGPAKKALEKAEKAAEEHSDAALGEAKQELDGMLVLKQNLENDRNEAAGALEGTATEEKKLAAALEKAEEQDKEKIQAKVTELDKVKETQVKSLEDATAALVKHQEKVDAAQGVFDKLEGEKAKLDKAVLKTEQEVADIQAEIEEAEEEIAKQNKLLAKRDK